jgi:hypothetical protein
MLWQEAVAVDYRGREVDLFAVVGTRVLAQHLKGGLRCRWRVVPSGSFGALDQRAASEGSCEVVILGEASQHDVDRALPFLDIGGR